MSIWPRALRFLWEEEPASLSPGPASDTRGETTGVPQFLQRATRWSMTATIGATLMGQIVGVRLIAPVDAHGSYMPKNACQRMLIACQDKCGDDLRLRTECFRAFLRCVLESRGSALGHD